MAYGVVRERAFIYLNDISPWPGVQLYLALVSAAKGYRIKIVTSDAFSKEKLDQMAALGAVLTLVPSEGALRGHIVGGERDRGDSRGPAPRSQCDRRHADGGLRPQVSEHGRLSTGLSAG